MRKPGNIAPAKGKLGVLTPGMGAVSTTFMAGVELVRKGKALPVGSLTQMGTIRLGKRTEGRTPENSRISCRWRNLNDLVFGGWDIFPDNAYEAATQCRRARRAAISTKAQKFLKNIKPMKAAFDQNYVKKLSAARTSRKRKNKFDLAEQLRDDIRDFKKKNKLARTGDDLVRLDGNFPEAGSRPQRLAIVREGDEGESSSHRAFDALRLRRDQRRRALRQWRAESDRRHSGAARTREGKERAHLRQGFQDRPDADEDDARAGLQGAHAGTARLVFDEHSRQSRRRSARRSRLVQDQGRIEARRARIHSAAEAVSRALRQDLYHKVRINYYPPRGDNKEGWDNIDIFGWLGYPMQIKVDFLCRDSILAAPIVLDLVLFLDLAQRAGMRGIQEWLSFYFKSPMCAPELYPEHDLFIQSMKLKNTLRWMMGEDLITHLGSEYYD